jgi:hypothetical protein
MPQLGCRSPAFIEESVKLVCLRGRWTWGSRMTTDDTKRPQKAMFDYLIGRRENAIIDALFASERMECTKRYLSRGRRFGSMETDEIKQRWIAATRKYQVSYGEVDPREMDDLTSELDLRKVDPPREAVRDATERVAQRIRRDHDPETHARVRARIRKFLDDLEKPRN